MTARDLALFALTVALAAIAIAAVWHATEPPPAPVRTVGVEV